MEGAARSLDAEVARLEILNEALDPLFSEIPDSVDIFDRGISQGDQPRLWIDVVAHVMMGRDKRTYRFVQDTRYGRIVLSESTDIAATVEAILLGAIPGTADGEDAIRCARVNEKTTASWTTP